MDKILKINNRKENQIVGDVSEKSSPLLLLGFIAAGLLLDIAIVLYVLILNVL